MTHELFSTTKQTTKTRNTFGKKMLTDIKLIKVQISKIIQSNIFLVKKLGKLGHKHC